MKLYLSILLLLFSTQSAAQCNVKMRVYQSPPNYYRDDQGQWTGLAFELANAVIKEAGCTAEFINVPWKRALRLLELGKLDLMTSLSVTKERRKFIDFFGVQSEEVIVPIVKKSSSFNVTSLDDLKSLPNSVGFFRGAFYGKTFKQKRESELWFNKKVVAYSSTKELLKGLRRDRLSLFFYNKANARYMLSKYQDGADYEVHPYVMFRNTIYFGLSKFTADKSLLARMRQAYFRVRESGELSAIEEHYKNKDFRDK